MYHGSVLCFNVNKGVGFIQSDDGKGSIIVYVNAVTRAGLNELKKGQKLTYFVVIDGHTGKSKADFLKVINLPHSNALKLSAADSIVSKNLLSLAQATVVSPYKEKTHDPVT